MTSLTVEKPPGLSAADRELLQQAVDCLHRDGYGVHRTLTLTIHHGAVIVQGRVPTYYLRQMAIARLLRLPGTPRIIDRIEVVSTVDSTPQTVTTQTGTGLDAAPRVPLRKRPQGRSSGIRSPSWSIFHLRSRRRKNWLGFCQISHSDRDAKEVIARLGSVSPADLEAFESTEPPVFA